MDNNYSASTPAECLAAVKQNGRRVEYLSEAQRTPEVCLAAVMQKGWRIGFLTEAQRTPEVCLAAVKQDGLSIGAITEAQRTPEVCLAAVKQDGRSVHYLTEAQRTQEVEAAAKQTVVMATCYYTLLRNFHGKYSASCHRNLTLEQALKHWGPPRTDPRARIFYEALTLEAANHA